MLLTTKVGGYGASADNWSAGRGEMKPVSWKDGGEPLVCFRVFSMFFSL